MTHIQKSTQHKETSLNQLVTEINQNFDLHQKWTTIIDSNNRAEIFFKYYCHPVAVLIDPNSHREQLGQKLLKSASSSTFFVVNLGNQSENSIFHQDYFPKELLNPTWLSNKANIQQFASNFRQEFSQVLGLNPNFRLVFLLSEKEPAEAIKASTAVVQISSQNSETLEQKVEVMREKVKSMKHEEQEVKRLAEIKEKEVREQYVKDQEIYATKKATLKVTPTKRKGRLNEKRSPIANGERITRAPDSQDRAGKNHEYGILKYDSAQKRSEHKRQVQIFEEQSLIQGEDLKVQIENAKKRGQIDKLEQDKFREEDLTQEPSRIKELRIPEKSLLKTDKESPLNYKSVSSRFFEEDHLGSQDSQEKRNQVTAPHNDSAAILVVSQGQAHSTYAQAEKAEEAIRSYHPQTTGLEAGISQVHHQTIQHHEAGIPHTQTGTAQISYTQSYVSPRTEYTGQVQDSTAISYQSQTSQQREAGIGGAQVHISPRTEYTATPQTHISPRTEYTTTAQVHVSPKTEYTTTQTHISPRTEYTTAPQTHTHISPRTEYTTAQAHVSPRTEYATPQAHISPVHQQGDYTGQVQGSAAVSYQSQTSQHREAVIGGTQYQISPRTEYITTPQTHISPRTEYTAAQIQAHVSPIREEAGIAQTHASPITYAHQTSQEVLGSHRSEHVSPRPYQNEYTSPAHQQAQVSARSHQSQTSQHREVSPTREAVIGGSQVGYTQSQFSPRTEYTTAQVHVSPRTEYTTAQAHISPSHHVEQALASGRSYQSQTSQHREGSPTREAVIGGAQAGYTQSQFSPRTEYTAAQVHVSPRTEYTTAQVHISPRGEYTTTTQAQVEQALASGRSYHSQTSQHREGSPTREAVISGTQVGYTQSQVSPRTDFTTAQVHISPRTEYTITQAHISPSHHVEQALASGRSYQSQTSQHREGSPTREVVIGGTQVGYTQSQVSPRTEYTTGQVHISPRAEYTTTTQAQVGQALASGRSYQSQTSQHREGSPTREAVIGGAQAGYTQSQFSPRTENTTGQVHISPRAEYTTTTQAQVEQALASGRSYQSQTSQHREAVIGGAQAGYTQSQASPRTEYTTGQVHISPRAEYTTTQAHTSPIHQQTDYILQQAQTSGRSYESQTSQHREGSPIREAVIGSTQVGYTSGRSYESQTSQQREGSPVRETGYTQSQVSPRGEYTTTTQAQVEQALASGRSYQSQTSHHREGSPVREAAIGGAQVGYTQSQVSPRGEYTTATQAQVEQALASGRSYHSQTSQHREGSPVRETGYTQSQVSPRTEYTTAQAHISPSHHIEQALASGRSYQSQTSQHREGSPIRETGYTQAQVSPRGEYTTTTQAQVEQALASGRSYQSQTSQNREGSPIRETIGVSPRTQEQQHADYIVQTSGRSYESQTSQHRESSPIRETGYTQAQVSPRGEYTTATAQAQVEQALASGRSYEYQTSQHRESSPIRETGYTQAQVSPRGEYTTTTAQVEQALASARSYQSQTSQHREASPVREGVQTQASGRSYESQISQHREGSPIRETGHTQAQISPSHHVEQALASGRSYHSQTSQHREASPVRTQEQQHTDFVVQTSERSYEHREASPVREPSQVSPSHQADYTHVSPRQAEVEQRETSSARSQQRDVSPVRETVEVSQTQVSPRTEAVKRAEVGVLESRIQEEEAHAEHTHHEDDKESNWVEIDEHHERIALGSDNAEEQDEHEHDEDDVDFEEQERMIIQSERTNRFKDEEYYEEEKAGEEEEEEEESEEDEEEEYEVSGDEDEQIPVPSRKVIQGPEGEEIVVLEEGDQEKIEPTAVVEGQPEETAVIGVDMGGDPLQKGTKKKKKGKKGKKGAKKGDKAAGDAKKADGAGKKPKTGSKTPATKGSAKKPAAGAKKVATGTKKAATGAKSTSKPKTSGVKSPAGVKSPGRPGAKVTKAKSPAGKSPTKAKSPAKAKSPTKAKSPGKSPTKTPGKATTAKAKSPGGPSAKSSARKASPAKTGSPTPKKALGKAKSPGKSPKKTGEGTAKKAAKTKNPKT